MLYSAFIEAWIKHETYCLAILSPPGESLAALSYYFYSSCSLLVSWARKGTCLLQPVLHFHLQAGFDRRKPKTQRQSHGASKLSPVSQSALLWWRTRQKAAQKQQKSIYPFCFSPRGKEHCLSSCSGECKPEGEHWEKSMWKWPHILQPGALPYTSYGPNLPWKAPGLPPGWWQRCLDDNEGNNSSHRGFSSPPLWSLCRELGGGREVETAAAASPHRDREALKKVQHIQTPLKSYLKIHFNQQVWGPSGCWKLGRCKCFSSLTTQPYFDTR